MVQDKKTFVAVGETVDDYWQVIKLLGEGGFGAVYEVKGLKGEHLNKFYAMKVEPKEVPEYMKMLAMEREVLRELRDIHASHFCQHVGVGIHKEFRYLVVALAGKSLADLLCAVGHREGTTKQFSLCTSLYVGIELLEAIKELHKVGYLHRDVSLANCAAGREPDTRRIYMLDLGMCRKYLKDDKTHRLPRTRPGFRGSFRYASPRAHREEELSRRDDLLSWLFVVVDMTLGKLPWDGLEARKNVSETDLMKKIGQAKEAALLHHGEALLHGCPREFQKAYDLVVSLSYADEPDYDLIRAALKACQQRKEYKDDTPLDWDQQAVYGA